MGDASEEVTDSRPVVYVTGFGPFPSHAVNASQMAVEGLLNSKLEKELGVKLVTETVKVEYDYVQKIVPERWRSLKPKLTVHVGVSGQAETLTLEQLAHNNGYNRRDNCGCMPNAGLCSPDGDQVIHSGIQMDLISRTINKNTNLNLPCVKSTDPGRFLCDFIYYLSLKEDRLRSAFIHVPTLNKFSAQDISAAVAAAIKEMYKQVVERDTLKGEENGLSPKMECAGTMEEEREELAETKVAV
ncbi:pyroglutamyl-peptidase 1 [Procambarus clarkii]|uniref:pyroglutamyl-peptidase 1 n=1 Tax=Procambarus clarkii TaxID=6728 RepID=UPI001E671A32|nr:pyroglutamyl-peptidase 1-like [Procambarus clarkii]